MDEKEIVAAKLLIDLALKEDIGDGDVTAQLIPEKSVATARIFSKQAGIVCGVEIAKLICENECEVEILKNDGEKVLPNEKILTITGNSRTILTLERTILNFMGRLSGISTETAKYVEKAGASKIFDTRKTTPGYRLLEKYAVRCGGGNNHRIGLYDMILIKENHIIAKGSIKKAVEAAKLFGKKIMVEAENLGEVGEACEAGADIVMLDNMSNKLMGEAVRSYPNVVFEASGNVNLQTVESMAGTGVQRISVGSITHSAPVLDLSMRF